MSKLFLNMELTRRAQHHLTARVPGENEYWYVCPACCWVALWVAQPGDLKCPRPRQDFMASMSAATMASRIGAGCDEVDQVWIEDIAPRVAASLSTALRLGGTNAVIDMLSSLEPIEIGLDDPGGKPHTFYFYEVRPGSTKSDDEGVWHCTYREDGRILMAAVSHPGRKVVRKR